MKPVLPYQAQKNSHTMHAMYKMINVILFSPNLHKFTFHNRTDGRSFRYPTQIYHIAVYLLINDTAFILFNLHRDNTLSIVTIVDPRSSSSPVLVTSLIIPAGAIYTAGWACLLLWFNWFQIVVHDKGLLWMKYLLLITWHNLHSKF